MLFRSAEAGLERAQCQYFIGHSYLKLNKHLQAFQAFTISLEERGDEVDLYLEFLESAVAIARVEEALKFLKGLRTKSGNYYHSLFLFHISRLETSLALKILSQGLRKYPKEPMFLYYKATTYAVEGRFNLALRNLEQACVGDPSIIMQAQSNACFASLRDQAEFKEFLDKIQLQSGNS